MSENLDLVRSIIGDWERGDVLTSAEWGHPDIECVMVDGPVPSRRTGSAGMAEITREFVSAYADFSVSAQEYREIGGQIAGRNTSLLHINTAPSGDSRSTGTATALFADPGIEEYAMSQESS